MTHDHIKWISAYRKALNDGDFATLRDLRIAIYSDTVKVAQSKCYTVCSQHVDIDNEQIVTEFFTQPAELSPAEKVDTHFAVIQADCLEAAGVLIAAGLNPCVLNLASRRNPGGGVLNGAGAQEENIFRRTNLFMSLYQFTDYAEQYGIKPSRYRYPLDPNTGGIYTGNATVFRGSESNGYCFLRQPFQAAFVTVPALNRPQLVRKGQQLFLADDMVAPTKRKIRTILRIAGKYGHDGLVLGAFGCGAFQNPPNHIALLFREVFAEAEFAARFRTVLFAIISDHNSNRAHNPHGNVLPFLEVFDGQ